MKHGALDSWQYRLSSDLRPQARPVGPFWLETGPDLPVITIRDAEGTSAGLLLGFPIDLAGKQLLATDWTAPASLGAGLDDFANAVLLALGGRFLWICVVQGPAGATARIYPDCSAQVSCVFDPVAGMTGSTAFALLEDPAYETRFDSALFDHLGIDGEGWFPAGLTAHHGVQRLLPNHVLDLTTWTIQRFWPKASLATATDPSATVDEIIALVQAQIEALLQAPKNWPLP